MALVISGCGGGRATKAAESRSQEAPASRRPDARRRQVSPVAHQPLIGADWERRRPAGRTPSVGRFPPLPTSPSSANWERRSARAVRKGRRGALTHERRSRALAGGTPALPVGLIRTRRAERAKRCPHPTTALTRPGPPPPAKQSTFALGAWGISLHQGQAMLADAFLGRGPRSGLGSRSSRLAPGRAALPPHPIPTPLAWTSHPVGWKLLGSGLVRKSCDIPGRPQRAADPLARSGGVPSRTRGNRPR